MFSAGIHGESVEDHAARVKFVDNGDPVIPALKLNNPLRERARLLKKREGARDCWLTGEVLEFVCDVDLHAQMSLLATAAHKAWASVDPALVFKPAAADDSGGPRVYKDTHANRKLQRVGDVIPPRKKSSKQPGVRAGADGVVPV